MNIEQEIKKIKRTLRCLKCETGGTSAPPSPAGETYYVEQRFTGSPSVTLSGTDMRDVTFTSTNPDYTAQLSSAIRGSEDHPYPCIWSARDAAIKAIIAGDITKAFIVVKAGYTVTIGSSILAQNGTIDGSLVASQEADIKFDSEASGLALSSLFASYNGTYYEINYYFEPNTTIYNIAKFPLYILYNNVPIDTTSPVVKNFYFLGEGNFYAIYGLGPIGTSARCIDLDVRYRVDVFIQQNAFYFHQRDCLIIRNARNTFLKARRIWGRLYGLIFINTTDWRTLSSQRPVWFVEVDDMKKGNNNNGIDPFVIPNLPAPSTAFFDGTTSFVPEYGGSIHFNVKRYSISGKTAADGSIFRISNSEVNNLNTMTNIDAYVNVGELYYQADPSFYGAVGYSAGIKLLDPFTFSLDTPTSNTNNRVVIKIGKHISNNRQGFDSSLRVANTHIHYEVDEAQIVNNTVTTSQMFNIGGTITTDLSENVTITVKGRYLDNNTTPSRTFFNLGAPFGATLNPDSINVLLDNVVLVKKNDGAALAINSSLPADCPRVTVKDSILINSNTATATIQKGGGAVSDVLVMNTMATAGGNASVNIIGEPINVQTSLLNFFTR